LQTGESWIDVNVSQQTLVAFRGETPTYATLVSTGKESSIKAKDHRTPHGAWRIRVKHVTDTMDGDGSAAGDLPYSIEDVPYVMYFHRSYALHGAFWHRNYGVRMSHGCVNLAPLDAKHVFFAMQPMLPAGAHGVWSDDDVPGSIIQVHD
jgi:lipoprotein-anchoring transpeptidase ErfK/SrfK